MPVDLAQLVAPERNRYFYGLLMDAERFQKDQDYFNRKRLLLNRFIAGSGVVCGLGLTYVAAAGGKPASLTLAPGAAIDHIGREIIVPAQTPIDITQLTDATGKPTGPVPANATILVALAYVERKTDAVAVLVPDCDALNNCAPSTIAEGFVVLVSQATGAAPPAPGCPFGKFPLPPGAALQTEIAGYVADAYGAAPSDASIALGRLDLSSGTLDAVSDRPIVYDNTLLYHMIVCLAAEVAQLAGTILSYVSGDNQSAKAGNALAKPLVVALLDANGNPVTGGAAPQFTPASGSVGTVTSPSPGQYQATWTLGSTKGQQTLTVSDTQSKLTVTFSAKAT